MTCSLQLTQYTIISYSHLLNVCNSFSFITVCVTTIDSFLIRFNVNSPFSKLMPQAECPIHFKVMV